MKLYEVFCEDDGKLKVGDSNIFLKLYCLSWNISEVTDSCPFVY